jgi:diadenosine tetraphosphate (Ap4A) HIT family hydrolase
MNLYNDDNWEVIYAHWCQEFPGYCIVSCNKERLSDLTSDDWVNLGKIEKELERVTKNVFDATMYTFACLLNTAYRDKEKPHVHFHFIPRYDGERIILNKKYKDRHFGYNMWKWSLSKFKAQKDIFTKEEKDELFKMMQQEWNLM